MTKSGKKDIAAIKRLGIRMTLALGVEAAAGGQAEERGFGALQAHLRAVEVMEYHSDEERRVAAAFQEVQRGREASLDRCWAVQWRVTRLS